MADENEVSAALKKLNLLLAEKKLVVFDEREAEALREVAAFWIASHKTGRILLWLRHPIMWIGYGGGLYVTFKSGGIVEVLKGFFK